MLSRRRIYQARQRYLPYLFAAAGAILALNLVGVLRVELEPVQFVLDVNIGFPGYTTLKVPPIGSITAKTHSRQPLQLTLSLENIDLDQLRRIAATTDLKSQQALVSYFHSKINRIIGNVIFKLALIAAGGGLLGGLLSGARHWRILLACCLTGSLIVLICAASVYVAYDIQAFAQPQYQGILEAAPWMLSLIQEGLVKVDQLGEQVQSLAANLYTVFNQIENLKNVGVLAADLLVLHVSDIHNHPAAFDFISQVVGAFPIDLIIDTGDLTDWGTPLEAEIITRIEELAIPYLFAAGNHEVPDVLARLGQTSNVTLLGSEPVTVSGITVAGMLDPSAGSFSPESVSVAEISRLASEINGMYRGRPHGIDIFAVHNYRIAAQIEPGIFPVIVCGHNHVPSISQIDATVYVNAGTTGAAGIRGIQAGQVIPFSLSVLYFVREPETNRYVLAAVDSIQVQSLKQSFTLQRTFVTSERRNQEENVEESTENQASME
ncbi:MAG: metallophosphoesterase family protein [Limnochordia bacterium]